MRRSLLVFSFVIAFLPTFIVHSQDFVVKGRTALEFDAGMWGGSSAVNTVSLSGVRTEAKTSGFVGGFQVAHWLQERTAMTFGFSVLGAEATSRTGIGGPIQRASTVMPLLLGLRYAIPNPDPDARLRPYVSAAIGTYIGMEASNSTLSQQARTEQAFGARLAAGFDLFIGSFLKLGVNAGYHVMTDFDSPIGERANYNSGQFGLGFGFVF